jgi:hypothetical protein
MTRCSFTCYGLSPSQGHSREADFVVAQSKEINEAWESSHYLFGEIARALDELDAVYRETSKPGWDGYSAKATAGESYALARKLLLEYRLGILKPAIGADPDGEVTLEWYHAPRRVLSVSVAPNGDLHYAALIGESSRWGTEPFYGSVPDVILELIEAVRPT